ncbi:hypothetical protein SKAU_G00152350 [Synaphobranchus kaupii]|uniref:Uncharacterized protein n=1 Tax=Synaphobranchus kaupii TaxID=118154 RepID=A0A9Q1IYX9_SYNKA|nr:hypothetical protein SKAU_G00152350 [Synaphobranchus kaupii]
MKGGRRHRGCACRHLFRKVLAKCGCCYARHAPLSCPRGESFSPRFSPCLFPFSINTLRGETLSEVRRTAYSTARARGQEGCGVRRGVAVTYACRKHAVSRMYAAVGTYPLASCHGKTQKHLSHAKNSFPQKAGLKKNLPH